MNDFFDRSGRPPGGHDGGMCRCTVVSVSGNTIIADDVDESTTTRLTIIVPSDSPTATTSTLKAGDVFFVAGDREGGIIKAFGIRKLPPGSPSIMPAVPHDELRNDPDDDASQDPGQAAPFPR
jgi:hypothetical protein